MEIIVYGCFMLFVQSVFLGQIIILCIELNVFIIFLFIYFKGNAFTQNP